MRLIFAGTPDVAIPSLEALIDAGHEIALVVTQPDARGKRGSALHPSPVKVRAEHLGLDVATPSKASDPDFVERVRALDADAAAVVAYGQILRPALLAATRLGWVNLHFSVLPAWRGAAPVQRAIQAGDDVTGASTFLIEEGLDTGPVIGQATERIRPTDTAGDLLARLAVVGAPLLKDSLEALGGGYASPVAQPEDGVSHAAKLSREDALIRWDLPAHVIDRAIRACTPAPGAWTTLPDGSTAKIGPVTEVAGHGTTPGLLKSEEDGVTVGTGTAPVKLSWIQPAGKSAMDAGDWWRGARWGTGAQLGEA
ncbi:methionyl-tRNA formyltransferase [Demequina sp. TTPB684]|uniref:methionyl-tRNA formyltransferase n=1 Tax=unclassified Demequina TaxID=2620311 RepID=UPI001CF2174A|nr:MULTISPECIES: methionyl-tRNA formyltransferase [unclassified Demequina]MCB2413099.1 methionyl-tRNA formyltransferase [Demequina sp. TTPB684]UPU89262.1 methionyl-tRNA formyltransferase [Demequina sp. TMPB413]